ncbi:MAG: pitrilysin family protein, partial [Bdellovibrionota bacterium]
STAYKVHPYKWPVIGIMKTVKEGDKKKIVGDVDNVTVEIAQNFHRTYYAPNNAVVVVAGDFKSEEAKKLIEKYYGAIKSQPIPKKNRPAEPTQTSPRSQFLAKDVQNVQFVVSHHTPKAGTDEVYALDLLANVMGAGPSSRLYQRLVYKDQIATSATAYNLTMQEGGLFEVMVSLKPGSDFRRAERAIRGELWRPRNLVVSEEELQKAKNQVMKSYVDGLKTIHGKAEALALNEILFDDYEQLFKDLDRYNKVTADQIKKVAAKYLGSEHSTLVMLRPGPGSQKSKRGR